MRQTRDEMRARIEEALRALAPGPYERMADMENLAEDEPESGCFLISRGPMGAEITYFCDEDSVRIDFGPGGGGMNHYNTVNSKGEDNFTEDDLKGILKSIIQDTLDIRAERVFGGYYKVFLLPVGGLYPVSEFETLSKKRGFESVSWNGTYTRP